MELGLTQVDFALKIGVGVKIIRKVEQGDLSLKGEKAWYSRVMFRIDYLVHKNGNFRNGEKVYTELPQTFSFSRIVLYFPEKLHISYVSDFKKHADKIVVNFIYIG